MSTVNELMLKTIKLMELVHTGTATGGTTSTLLDTFLTDTPGRYTSGTLWMLTGSNAGKCWPVSAHGLNNLSFDAVTTTILAGDKYAVATSQFPKWLLEQAVDTALEGIDVIVTKTEAIVSGAVTLSAGVSNVRRVYIAGKENYHWNDPEGGVLTFDNTGLSGAVDIKYIAKANSTVDVDGNVGALIDIDHVAWGAVVFLWRNLIERIHKDNPSAIDLLNEAKINEAAARSKFSTYPVVSLSRSPRYSKWVR